MKKIFILLFVFVSLKTVAQKLTSEEKKIISGINKQLPQTMQLLEEIVNINSGTLNIEGVKKTGQVLREEFDKIGFTTEWVSLPDSLKRAGHLVASVKGRQGKKLLLIG